RRGEPLASGATPVSGAARRGPTASVASTARLPAECMANCIANNHKLSRSFLCEPGRLELLKNMIDGYFDIGGMQIQFNMVNSRVLRDAMANPENYQNLLVRISGYNAYFVNLNREMQLELIERTEYTL
ncbi:MAG: hypothetical protein KKC20_19750, partial [Proteobacteria bacterium]|nr:hypothetical protein [Pseudomonadota bacterium]